MILRDRGESVMSLLSQRCATDARSCSPLTTSGMPPGPTRVVFLNDGRLAGETGPPPDPECLLETGRAR